MKTLNRDQLIQYMLDNKDNNRGLVIMGEVGVGKTLITNYLTSTKYIKPGRVNKIFSDIMCKIAGKNMDLIAALINDHYFKNTLYLLDDVGTENNVNNYGIILDYVENYIDQAYVNYSTRDSNYGKLIMTTNLTPKELETKYGHRAMDRINEFCDIIILDDFNIRSSEHLEYTEGLKQRLKDLHDQYFNIPLMIKKQIKTN